MPSAEHDALKPPPLWQLAIEGRAVYELLAGLAARPVLRRGKRGDGHPVMVLPGFVASDLSTRPLRRFLRAQGWSARPWGFGRNLGPRGDLEDRMASRVRHLRRIYGAKVSLVGWSLGGVYAREVAREVPEDVRQVITMGSPFGHPKANRSWRLFERLSGLPINEIDPQRFETMRTPPPVPTTAIYSRTDGVANWRCCVERTGEQSESIGVPGSHCGLGWNPVVQWAIADRLGQPEGAWKPFRRRGLERLLYERPKRNRRRVNGTRKAAPAAG